MSHRRNKERHLYTSQLADVTSHRSSRVPSLTADVDDVHQPAHAARVDVREVVVGEQDPVQVRGARHQGRALSAEKRRLGNQRRCVR